MLVPQITLDLAAPAGCTVTGLVGAARSGDFVYVFVVCGDGNLWSRWFLKNSWSTWTNLNAPVGGLIPGGNNSRYGVIVAGGSIWLFCAAADGNVWTNLWSAQTQRWNWMLAPGAPVGTKVTSIVGATASPFAVAVRVTDGSTWGTAWNGAAWPWIKSPAPAFPSACLLYWENRWNTPNTACITLAAITCGVMAVTGEARNGPSGVADQHYTNIAIEFLLQNGKITCQVAGTNETTYAHTS